MSSTGLQPYRWRFHPHLAQCRLKRDHPITNGMTRCWITAPFDSDSLNKLNTIRELVTAGWDNASYAIGAATVYAPLAYGVNGTVAGTSITIANTGAFNFRSGQTAALSNNTPVSVAGWLNFPSADLAGPFSVLLAQTDGDVNTGFALIGDGTFLSGVAPAATLNGQQKFTQPSWWTTATWYHYVLTWDGVPTLGSWNLYINGIAAAKGTNQTGSGTHNSGAGLAFTVTHDGQPTPGNILTNSLYAGPICVWNRIISQTEAELLANEPFAMFEAPASRTYFLPGSYNPQTYNQTVSGGTYAAGRFYTHGGCQEAGPASDISTGSWTPTPLWSNLSETDQIDTTLITSSKTPSNDTCEVKLASLTDPSSSVGHVVYYRYEQTGTDTVQLTVSLVQGTTIIASWAQTVAGGNVVEAEQTLTVPQTNSITDYTDLRLRFVALKI